MSDIPSFGPITLGIDLGTSALKVVALGPEDRLLGEAEASFPTLSLLPQQAEQDPADWLRAAAGAMRCLHENLCPVLGSKWTLRVCAIGLTAQLPTLVCMPARGSMSAAITWRDGRADAGAAARLDLSSRAHMYALTGMPIDGRYLAPMFQHHFAARLDEVRMILSAKDYLLSELTGSYVTEPSTAAGYGIYDLQAGRFSEELSKFWSVPPALLPPIQAVNSYAGPLHAAGARLLGLRPGIPVSTGAADSVCAAYAMSGLDESVVSVSLGSSAVVLGASSVPRLDPQARYLLTPHVQDAWYGREMDLLASGTGYRWLTQLFNWTDGDIDRYAADSVPGAKRLVFAPYLAGGEQGALWNPHLRAALLGLGLQHSRADIARAYVEGVFFEIRRCIEVLAETVSVKSVMVCGNVVNFRSSIQILADVLQRPVGTLSARSAAAIGAARLAHRMAGVAPHGIVQQPREDRPVVAMGSDAAAYEALYRQYLLQSARCG